MYRLYHHPLSQHARRVVALLEEARLPYAPEPVALEKREHFSSAYLRINPNHQVPALVDGDLILTESNAMLRYLCSKHGLEDFYPSDLRARARTEQWLDWNQWRLGRNVIDVVRNSVFLAPNGDRDAIVRGRRAVEDAAPVLAAQLWETPFVTGQSPTIADLSIDSNITQLSLAGAEPEDAPIRAWRRRMSELYGVRRSRAALDAMMVEIAETATG
jgi:glutathione S-transferase